MTNAFHWQGKPSIFTTNVKQQNFGEAMTRKHLATSMRRKPTPIDLPGGSPYEMPDLLLARNPLRDKDALRSGGELGKKRNKGTQK